jgi:chromosomal replication initiation ATPase DnaA
MPSQIPLPLETPARLGREDFIVGAVNSAAVGLIDSWPHWSAPAAALYGPAGCGKSHLAGVWAQRSAAAVTDAASLEEGRLAQVSALAVEDVDAAPLTTSAESALFALIERGQPLLLTGSEPPSAWRSRIPDLISRFRALVAFPLWAPDDALLAALAKKMFADRQLVVPDAVVDQMVRSLERSPAAIREFVGRADAAALAQKRPVTLGFIRDLLAKNG